jgi:hypothetical protein
VIVWRGLSALDGRTPIVVILTGHGRGSGNRKTGHMVQSYILVDGARPIDAINNGADAAICGQCPMRKQPTGERKCYVNLATGLLSVGNTLMRGGYPTVTVDDAAMQIAGKVLRIGTYGDPCAVPIEVWRALLAHVSGWTGYTHQWHNGAFPEFRSILMASADDPASRMAAQDDGWRTFRVRRMDTAGNVEPLRQGEIACPASQEAGHRTTCADCQLCKGTASGAKSIAIIDHSTRANAVRRRVGSLRVIQ